MEGFDKLYTVDDIAQMTMLTTRTIRNYLKDGLLTGRKIGGQWRFTEKDIQKLFENSAITAAISDSRKQEVLDFMDGINTDIGGDIQICTIIDYYCSDNGVAKTLSESFSGIISDLTPAVSHKYYYEYIEKEQKARYILLGAPGFIKAAAEIINNEWNRINASLGKFTDRAVNYAKYRPSYPEKAIECIFNIIGKDNIIAADIGSGTGRMSSLLLPKCREVYAVEPNSDMRRQAEAELGTRKNFSSVNGTAENTTLISDSIDLITCAECYHWFDNEKTILELKRILKPDGYVFLLWNSPGDNAYTKEMDELFEKYCRQNASEAVYITKDDLAKHLFGEGGYTKTEFDNSLSQTYDALLGGMLSSSYAPTPGDKEYEPYVKGIKDIFNKYGCKDLIETRFRTVVYYGKL